MSKRLAALEISSKVIKILLGYEIDGKVYTVYTLVKPLGLIRNNGAFIDPQNTISSIEAIKNMYDETYHMNLNLEDVLLALPPEDLKVYETQQVTTVLSEESKVDEIDIRNIYALIRKSHLGMSPTNNFVDIVPERYILDQGRIYSNPPFGETTNTLTLHAKVHTVSRSTMESFNEIIQGTGLTVRRNVVAPFAAVEYLNSMDKTPQDYILVDIGSRQTSVSLVGRKQFHSSKIFNWGGDNITERIASGFNIREADAERIKVMYGLDKRSLNFKAPVIAYMNEDGKEVKHYIDELNAIIKSELDIFVGKLNDTISALLEGLNPLYRQLPMLLIGGGSLLKGLEDYVLPKVQSQSVKAVIPETLGCRNPSFFTCLGMILVHSKYKEVFDDNHPKVGQVTRNSK